MCMFHFCSHYIESPAVWSSLWFYNLHLDFYTWTRRDRAEKCYQQEGTSLKFCLFTPVQKLGKSRPHQHVQKEGEGGWGLLSWVCPKYFLSDPSISKGLDVFISFWDCLHQIQMESSWRFVEREGRYISFPIFKSSFLSVLICLLLGQGVQSCFEAAEAFGTFHNSAMARLLHTPSVEQHLQIRWIETASYKFCWPKDISNLLFRFRWLWLRLCLFIETLMNFCAVKWRLVI